MEKDANCSGSWFRDNIDFVAKWQATVKGIADITTVRRLR
jgi:hypothetical protein